MPSNGFEAPVYVCESKDLKWLYFKVLENQSIWSLRLGRDPEVVNNVTVLFAMCCFDVNKSNWVYTDVEMEAASWQWVEALPFGSVGDI